MQIGGLGNAVDFANFRRERAKKYPTACPAIGIVTYAITEMMG
ncbi:hypothetical protein DSTSK_33640 [Desulforhabdus sp. TSK]|nr:hypothetical protein DSTSK_33640 [Desulforhabdus sp. TSK]